MPQRIRIIFRNPKYRVVLQNQNYLNKLLNRKPEIGTDFLEFDDLVLGNDEHGFRYDALEELRLTYIDIFGDSFRRIQITHTNNDYLPNCLWVHMDTLNDRLICEVDRIYKE
ncbi:MAG: hypothetical protein J0L87_01510 [Bacteroidetes bacterium]|nr:hypothetical protein [Bacteroidota bacterium]